MNTVFLDLWSTVTFHSTPHVASGGTLTVCKYHSGFMHSHSVVLSAHSPCTSHMGCTPSPEQLQREPVLGSKMYMHAIGTWSTWVIEHLPLLRLPSSHIPNNMYLVHGQLASLPLGGEHIMLEVHNWVLLSYFSGVLNTKWYFTGLMWSSGWPPVTWRISQCAGFSVSSPAIPYSHLLCVFLCWGIFFLKSLLYLLFVCTHMHVC